MKKRYEVRGMMEWHPVFKAGRTLLQVSFTGGCLCGGATTPAAFETSDPVVQKVIESSQAFRSKKITVGDLKEEHAKEEQASSPAVKEAVYSAGREPCHSIFEYSDEEDIYEFLHYEKGVPLENMKEKGSCYLEAERLGIRLVDKSKPKA